MVQNLSGRDFPIATGLVTQETDQGGSVPITLKAGPNPGAPRFFVLNEENGQLVRSLGVPVQLIPDARGMVEIAPGQRVVALWFDSHRIASELLFSGVTNDPDFDAVCPLVSAGALHANGDPNNGQLIALDPSEEDDFPNTYLGQHAVFRNYGIGAPCGTFVLSGTSSHFGCAEAGARCYVDRAWREMTSLSVQLTSVPQIVSSTSNGNSAISVLWNGSHAVTSPAISRENNND